jgi:hypothetical protein
MQRVNATTWTLREIPCKLRPMHLEVFMEAASKIAP